MRDILLVLVGGGVGSVARYKVGGWVLHHTTDWHFPAGTFAVNVTGCLVAGVLFGLAERFGWFPQPVRLLLFTGLLGGYTTFSAFGVEAVALIPRGEIGCAAWYVGLSVACGLVLLWLGIMAVEWAAGPPRPVAP